MKRFALAAILLGGASLPALAATEIQWWHAMTGANNDVIVNIAKDFNASQADYKVTPVYKGGYADTMNAGIAAFRAGQAPHILQVFEVGTATMMAAKGAVKPVYQLMAEAGEKFDPKAYLPTITGYYSTLKGEMLSFPFNSSSTVMWFNKDALKKAGLDPAKRRRPGRRCSTRRRNCTRPRRPAASRTPGRPGRSSSSSPPGTTCRSAPRPTASTVSTRS